MTTEIYICDNCGGVIEFVDRFGVGVEIWVHVETESGLLLGPNCWPNDPMSKARPGKE